jgi:oligopeptide/dipeptide ABC transporter ATP-binding protein
MTTPLLEVDDVRVQFAVRGAPRGTVLRAVDGVTLSLGKGETLGLVGESGCGKSSLLKAILGINRLATGSIRIDGTDVSTLRGKARRGQRARMQVVFQDPYSSLDPRMTVHDIVAEPLRIHHRYSDARVREVLGQVGIARDQERRKPSEFSGGQRQRIGIARALAMKPELLILDEPVSALDVSIQAQVVNLLADLQEGLGLSYLFVAHDLSVVRHMSQRIAVMYLGKIVEFGDAKDVFSSPQHPYTRSLLNSVPHPDPEGRDARKAPALIGEPPDPANPPSGCAFRLRCQFARADCAEIVPTLETHGVEDQLAACLHTEDVLTAAH